MKSKQTFNHMGKALKHARLSAKMTTSQNDLAKALGYKNGQYVSNIERGLCSLPAYKVYAACDLLGVLPSIFINAATKDYKDNYTREVKSSSYFSK